MNKLEVLIDSVPTLRADEVTVRHLETNQVLPLLMCEYGHHIYHGSSVAFGEIAVGVLGKSGMGKSTLSAALTLEGGDFIGDDALHISREGKEEVLIDPCDSRLRLWPEARDALFGSRPPKTVRTKSSQKTRFDPGKVLRHCDGPRALRVAYFLECSSRTDISIQPLSKTEAMVGWVSNAFIIDRSNRAALKNRHQRAARLAMIVPSFALDFPRDFSQLEELQKRVAAHAREVASQSHIV